MAILPKKLSLAQCNGPKIEVTYGLIGSLDFRLMWQLFMRASALSMESIDSARNTTEEDVNLRCSTILSDERILLVLSNHYRNQSKFGSNSTNLCMLTGKSKKLSVLEKLHKQQELAVQSLLERELLQHVQADTMQLSLSKLSSYICSILVELLCIRVLGVVGTGQVVSSPCHFWFGRKEQP
jgi:hypothetical protein